MMTKKRTKKIPPAAPPAGTTFSNCTFTAPGPGPEVLAVALAIAKASEAHAVALQKAASILMGNSAPLVVIEHKGSTP